jgi:Tfp pilus assembly PilM family ATPase
VLFAREVSLPRGKTSGTDSGYVPAVMEALDRYWESLTQRVKPFRLQRIYLSGGAAHDRELLLALKERTDLRTETLEPFRRISYSPASDPGKLVREHGASLAVAVGLALRGFDDL